MAVRPLKCQCAGIGAGFKFAVIRSQLNFRYPRHYLPFRFILPPTQLRNPEEETELFPTFFPGSGHFPEVLHSEAGHSVDVCHGKRTRKQAGRTGPGGVGKTSLVVQYLEGFFTSSYKPTVEDYYRSTIQMP
ncbi:hypothetical protein CEXT_536171, partial [Caerostris extrusa]